MILNLVMKVVSDANGHDNNQQHVGDIGPHDDGQDGDRPSGPVPVFCLGWEVMLRKMVILAVFSIKELKN